MPKRIQYGGKTHVFPDDFTDADIEAALASEPAEPEQPQGYQAAAAGADTIGEAPLATRNFMGLPSVTQALRALPTLGGALGGILGAPGLATSVGGAALGGAGGEAFKQLGFRALSGGGKADPLESAGGIAREAAIQGGAEVGGRLLGMGAKAGGGRLMQSALKPNVSLLKEYQTTPKELVQTLMDEGVNVSPGGLEKLQQLFSATNEELKTVVKNAPGHIDKKSVAARALPVAQRLSEQVNAKKALKDVGKTVTGFLDHPTMKGPLSVPEAQAMKVGTYKQIGKDYGKLSSASIETQKGLARGLREEIEAAAPQVAGLNAKEAKIMAAQDAVGHRVAIAGNRDPVGFAWVASSSPATFLAALFDRSPVVKSMVARGLYKSAGAISGVSPQAIRAAVAAVASDEPDAELAPQ